MVSVKRPSAVSSTATFMWRTLIKIKTAPGQLIFDSVVAIVSVLPMTVYAGSALCKDISTGVYDRFRTIGFWQPAPVLGTLIADILKYAIAVIGVVVKKPDSVTQNSMLILYTSIFASNIFTDISTMPGWMQTVVMFNPTTHIVTATRLLMHGAYNPWGITLALIVCAGLVAAFAPLTFALYARKNR